MARVRLVPGTGRWTINGRGLAEYFPNKVHQQLIKAPLVTVDRVDAFDIHAHLDGGRYVDDLALPGMVHGVVLRSKHAHAKILKIDTARAKAAPGVLAVLTHADWKNSGV